MTTELQISNLEKIHKNSFLTAFLDKKTFFFVENTAIWESVFLLSRHPHSPTSASQKVSPINAVSGCVNETHRYSPKKTIQYHIYIPFSFCQRTFQLIK
jgi:hypothetical protein